jgi:hypothetical protein
MSGLLSLSPSRSLLLEKAPILGMPSVGGGADSRLIDDRLKLMRKLVSGSVANLVKVKDSDPENLPLREQLLTKLASFKRITATIAMHLDRTWRETLFSTLDRLLDPDDWDPDFRLPTEQSFSTFLRMIIYLHPTKRPGLGLSPSGHILAAWSWDKDRIVIECVGEDEVRWVLSRTIAGERESGAGRVQLYRVPDVIAPYEPEQLFQDGDKILA